MEFGADARWRKELLELGRERSGLMAAYWKEYCTAYDAGDLG